MVFVAFLILAGPAAITWKLCELFNCRQSERVRDILLTLTADSFLILAGTYTFLRYVLKTSTISFALEYDPAAEASLFHVSFVWKYMVLSFALSVMLAAAKIVLQKLTQLRGKRHEKIS